MKTIQSSGKHMANVELIARFELSECCLDGKSGARHGIQSIARDYALYSSSVDKVDLSDLFIRCPSINMVHARRVAACPLTRLSLSRMC